MMRRHHFPDKELLIWQMKNKNHRKTNDNNIKIKNKVH